jgi:hypothetical protein
MLCVQQRVAVCVHRRQRFKQPLVRLHLDSLRLAWLTRCLFVGVGVQNCVTLNSVGIGQQCEVRIGNSGTNGVAFDNLYNIHLANGVCLNASIPCVTTGQTPLSASTAVNMSCTTAACKICSDTPSLPTSSCTLQPCATSSAPSYSNCDVTSGAQDSSGSGYPASQVYGVTFAS